MTRQRLVFIWAAAMFYNLNMTTGNDCLQWYHGSCTSNPCYNGGCCASLDHDFNCTCKPGWTGKTCQEADYCFGQSCSNGGTCISERNSFRCDCPIGWTGQDCSTALHTTDTPTTADSSSFGKECSQFHGYCSGNPCFNGGCCTSLDNDFKCTCKPGWTGKTCREEEMNECSRDNPCQNGGTCVGQKCTCPQGWTGNRCAADIDECAQSICKNGGTCNNIPGHYSCACASGWLGDDCQYRYPSCNHTCFIDAVILDQAIYDQNTTAHCTTGEGYAPNEDLLTVCCQLTNKRTWLKGDPVQISNVCEERRIPLYTPIAAFNGTFSIDDSAGIFYGCVKDRQPGFWVILQGCRATPHLLQVDQSSPFDSNSYSVTY